MSALVPTTCVWVTLSIWNKMSMKYIAPSLLAAYGRSVGLVGLKDIHDELVRNLGVKLTLTRTYQVFSTLGYLLSTISELKITNTGVGRVFFSFDVLSTAAFAYMLYLTTVYNSRLEESSKAFESSFSQNLVMRQSLNLPGLIGWVILNLFTIYVWINEIRKPLARNEILAGIGFLLISLGNMRSGFRTAMTSVADITPFVGALTIATASSLSAASLIPFWFKSSIARIYLAGYASVIYSVLLNAYYAFKQEKLAKRRYGRWSQLSKL